jgi:hypothetical protein
MKSVEDILAFLPKQNLKLAAREAKGESIIPPGLPTFSSVNIRQISSARIVSRLKPEPAAAHLAQR